MSKSASEIKSFNIRIAKDLWIFLKTISMHTGKPMTDIISEYIIAHKKKVDNKLTSIATEV